MSDLQCPARFVLLAWPAPAEVRLAGPGESPLSELEALADLHRGRTLTVGLDETARQRLPDYLRPDPEGQVTVEVDADGWRRVDA